MTLEEAQTLDEQVSAIQEDASEGVGRRLPPLPRQWTILLVSAAFMSALLILGIRMVRIEGEFLRTSALSDAGRYSEAIAEFRTVYTSEVAEPAARAGMSVVHDYRDKDNALPLPATLSMELGGRLSRASGGRVLLYSDYPFPARAAERLPLDAFQLEALRKLRERPNEAVYVFEDYEGVPAVRYATADLMRPSCVQCHNEHPQSPRQDWRVGDVRGVLEVIRPLHPQARATYLAVQNTVWLVVGAGALGLIALAMVALQLRGRTAMARDLLEIATDMNHSLRAQVHRADESEKRRLSLEEQILYTQKLETVGLLAGGVAHDFNNLLTAILGNATLAAERLPEDSAERKLLGQVQQGCHRAGGLTRQLLSYAGREATEKTPLELSKVVTDIADILAAAVPPNVSVRYEINNHLAPVLADRAQLEQVVLNLFTNACEATATQGGEVFVKVSATKSGGAEDSLILGSLTHSDDFVALEVRDSGPGLDAYTRSRIFDPFFSTKGAGRGLGLSALLGIVRSHDGVLELHSDPGAGAAFRVLFPVCERSSLELCQPTAPTLAQPRDGAGVGLPVVLVDDDPDIRATTAALLSTIKWEVLEAEGGRAALALVDAHGGRVSAVLLDMRMPEMGGEETFFRLRQKWPNVPVLITTGDPGEVASMDLPNQTRTQLLQKPYDLEMLRAALEQLATHVG